MKNVIYRWPFSQKGQFQKWLKRARVRASIQSSGLIDPCTRDYLAFIEPIMDEWLDPGYNHTEESRFDSPLYPYINCTINRMQSSTLLYHTRAATLTVPGLTLHILSPIAYFEGLPVLGRVLILQAQGNKNYIVLEKRKHFEERADERFRVCGYGLAMVDPLGEVKAIMDAWNNYFSTLKPNGVAMPFDLAFHSIMKQMKPIGTDLRRILKAYPRGYVPDERSEPASIQVLHEKRLFAEARVPVRRMQNVLTNLMNKKAGF